jgi:electron transport complex protein RnfG
LFGLDMKPCPAVVHLLKLRSVIKIKTPTPTHRGSLSVGVAALAVLVASTVAHAGGDHAALTTRSVLLEFFPNSQKVAYQTVTLAPVIKERIGRRLGYALADGRYTIFTATTGARIDGYAIIDDQLGQHQPITFATKLSPSAVVERVEIVAYREPRGDEVRDARFRDQFIGKTARDPLRLNRDIDAVSGATISSAATAVAVRRAAVLVEEIMLGHPTFATASGTQTASRTR